MSKSVLVIDTPKAVTTVHLELNITIFISIRGIVN